MVQPSLANSKSSRPSTVSTSSSFTAAFSSMEGSPFRYYLPHISTLASPVYTKNGAFTCNVAPHGQNRRIDKVGLFYHYISDESTEDKDVDTNGMDTVVDAPHGKVLLTIEPKVLDELRGSSVADPPTPIEAKPPLSFNGPNDLTYRPEPRVEEVDLCSYTAGEINCGETMVIESEELTKQRNKLTKEKNRRSQSVADISKKVKRMLRKFRPRNKAP